MVFGNMFMLTQLLQLYLCLKMEPERGVLPSIFERKFSSSWVNQNIPFGFLYV